MTAMNDLGPSPDITGQKAPPGFALTFIEATGQDRKTRRPLTAAKTIYPPPKPAKQYDRVKFWRFRPKTYADHEALAEALKKAAPNPQYALIRGAPIEGLDLKAQHRRLSASSRGAERTIDDAPLPWSVFDIDGAIVPSPLGDPDQLRKGAEWFRDNKMPAEFRDARCVVTATASTGLCGSDRLRARMYFCHPYSISNKEYKTYTKGVAEKDEIELDSSVCQPGQPIYTARPVFEGLPDPVPPENWVFVLDGLNNTVTLDLKKYLPAGKKAQKRLDAAQREARGNYQAFAQATVGRRGDVIGDLANTFFEPLTKALGLAARSSDSDDTIVDFLLMLIAERGPSRIDRYDRTWLLDTLRRFREKDEDDDQKQNEPHFRDRTVHPDVARVNRKYAIVTLNRQTTIAVVTNKKFAPVPMESFRLDLIGESVVVSWANEEGEEKTKLVPLADYWLENEDKRKYGNVVFNPHPEAARYGDPYPGGTYDADTGEVTYPDLNLWRGPAVARGAGKCGLTLQYILDIVCSGDASLFEWVMAWQADMYQNPHKKPGTSLCVRGEEGAGKTKLGEIHHRLLGAHYYLAASKRHFVGNFNSALADKLLVHVDEAFFAGDHETASAIKNLITAPDLNIEFKGKEPFVVDSYQRYLITGNPDQLLKAGMNARRFAALTISNAQIENHAYFKAIDDELDNGGAEAFLDYLLNLNISEVNLRKVPRTAELLKQKIYSMEPFDIWLMDLLMKGALPWCGREGNEVVSEQLFEGFTKMAARKGQRVKSAETEFGIKLRDFFGKGTERITKNWLTYKTRRRVPTSEGKLNIVDESREGYVYQFPPLPYCRKLFDLKLGQDVEWSESETEWLPAGTDPEIPF
jgi:Family of unknown function (DUF5906)